MLSMTTKDHTMPNVVRITLTLLCFLGSWSPVQAWVTEEHILIGEAGYQLACEGFRDPQVVRTKAQRGRAQQFCFQEDLARHYGELTAYGGDYAAEPEDIPTDFDTMSAQLAKLSDWSHIKNLLHRAKLALKDGTHFQPHAEEQWLHYHQRALTLAQQTSTAGDADQGFRRALVVSGFADHFLQDAFSAGHNGTDRMTTIPSLQKVYHDAFCCWGRFLANGLGETWFALGDGGLDKFCNRDGRQRVIAATAESVRSVLWHFIVGDGMYKEAQEVLQYLPKRYADQTFKLIPPQYDTELCPKPDFPMVRFRGRYLKCNDPDFFEVYINPQLRPATQTTRLFPRFKK
jgi:hypothetical protein